MSIVKDKITMYLTLGLIIIVLVQSTQSYFLQKKINKLYDVQIEEIDNIKEVNLIKVDSLESLKALKVSQFKNEERALYNSINKAKQNNRYYEELKKKAVTNNSVDSLERQFAERYSKKR